MDLYRMNKIVNEYTNQTIRKVLEEGTLTDVDREQIDPKTMMVNLDNSKKISVPVFIALLPVIIILSVVVTWFMKMDRVVEVGNWIYFVVAIASVVLFGVVFCINRFRKYPFVRGEFIDYNNKTYNVSEITKIDINRTGGVSTFAGKKRVFTIAIGNINASRFFKWAHFYSIPIYNLNEEKGVSKQSIIFWIVFGVILFLIAFIVSRCLLSGI